MKYLGLKVAIAVSLSPLAFVWRVAGREGLVVFLIVIGVFVGGGALLGIAHWAIQTVLVALGFDRKTINHDHCKSTVIFWRS